MKHVKEFLICLTVGLVLSAALVAMNYYSNVEKDNHYAEIYGIQSEGVENNE